MRNSVIGHAKHGASKSILSDLNKSYENIIQESENKVNGAMLG